MSTKKRKRRKRKDRLVLNLLILVTVVLAVFEGKLILTMFSMRNHKSAVMDENIEEILDQEVETELSTEAASVTVDPTSSFSQEATLAGVQGGTSTEEPSAVQTEASSLPTVSKPNSPALVRAQSTKIDDSYFADAAFIGDSRMEGFRNTSGITQGTFFTSVGMSLESMKSSAIIQTPEGTITCAAALSGRSYDKIYIMLGTNDLGEYDWDSFKEGFISVTKRFRELQPNAIFYICGVIYVEESKVSSGEYINNANVDKINSILLDICEEQGYYYLDLNEVLSDGWGSLIPDASSDGVHLYERYTKIMLDYLRSHYVPVAPKETEAAVPEESAETETEAQIVP